MRREQIELETLYVVRDWHVPDHAPVRFLSTTPVETVNRLNQYRRGALPAEYRSEDGTWIGIEVRPRDVTCPWNEPAEVAKRERRAINKGKANQAIQILATLGFNVDPIHGSYFDHTYEASVIGIHRDPEVTINIDAFIRQFKAYVESDK